MNSKTGICVDELGAITRGSVFEDKMGRRAPLTYFEVREGMGDFLGQLLGEVDIFDFIVVRVPLVKMAILAVLYLDPDRHANKIIIEEK